MNLSKQIGLLSETAPTMNCQAFSTNVSQQNQGSCLNVYILTQEQIIQKERVPYITLTKLQQN